LVGAQFDEPNGVLALAAFSSIFKLTGAGAETAVGRLDPVLAEAGGAVALEAAWRAILEVAHGSVEAVRRRLIGEPVRYDPPVDAVRPGLAEATHMAWISDDRDPAAHTLKPAIVLFVNLENLDTNWRDFHAVPLPVDCRCRL